MKEKEISPDWCEVIWSLNEGFSTLFLKKRKGKVIVHVPVAQIIASGSCSEQHTQEEVFRSQTDRAVSEDIADIPL